MLVAKRHHSRFVFALFIVATVAFICSLYFGVVAISPMQLLLLLVSKADAQTSLIVLELRLPRALLTVSIGCLLSCSGAVMQGLFRNPLADPSLIGVTAGASLGASAVIFTGLNASFFSIAFLSMPATVIGASVGAAFSVYFIYRVSTRAHYTSVTTMLLVGIALTAFVGGITNFMLFFADSETLRRLSLWRMGSLDGATTISAIIALCFAMACVAVLVAYAKVLNAFLLGESEARHLGVPVEQAKKILIVLVAIATGFSVAFAGTIAFVGLVVPHIARLFIGPDHRFLIPVSALGGAILLLVADIFARTLVSPTELPVGLLTALIGAPFFIVLLIKPRRLAMN